MKIGIVAAQGAFIEHITALEQLDTEAIPIRLPGELRGLDGLIIPGGESTAISRLIEAYDLAGEIYSMAKDGMPVFGTCAGMILMARDISGDGRRSLGLMDIRVRRNAFGRQIDSFETELSIPVLGSEVFPAVFIRAPVIECVFGDTEVLARLADDTIVAARQKNLLVSAFHPELTNDRRFHRYFLDMVNAGR